MKKYIYIAMMLLAATIMRAEELLNYPLDTVNGEEVYRYQVERGIGLYRIGVNFNVAQSDIIRLNPQLRERGLHYAEILLLPTGRPVILETKAQVVETVVTESRVEEQPKPQKPETDNITPSASASQDTILIAETAKVDSVVADSMAVDSMAVDSMAIDSMAIDSMVPDTRQVIELALMLPFESQQTKRSGNAERMMEFYQGALLALRDLQNDSTLYRLRVYDTERSERRVKELCDSTELDSVQGILGLVYPIQIDRVAEWCELHQVPLMLPFSDEMDLENHRHVLQFNSSDEQEADSLCTWIGKQENLHIAAVEVREADIASSIRMLRKQMKKNEFSYTGMALRDLMNDSVEYALDRDKENLIILHSDRFQHVRMLLPHLEKLQQAGYRIRIVSQYSWQKESISLPQVYTSMFVTDNDHVVYDAVWAENFKNSHVSESPRYDLLGYDLMHAMINWLRGEKEINGLQSIIRWSQVKEGGYQNSCVHVVAY